MTTQEMIAVMQAYVDGKPIQSRWFNPDAAPAEWVLNISPYWDWQRYEYRVKPEPMEIECWVKPCGSVRFTGAATHEALRADGWTKKKFREVI